MISRTGPYAKEVYGGRSKCDLCGVKDYRKSFVQRWKGRTICAHCLGRFPIRVIEGKLRIVK